MGISLKKYWLFVRDWGVAG